MRTLLGLTAFRNAYVIRGLQVWAILRIGLASAHLLAPVPLDLPLPVELGVLALVPLGVVLHARGRGEHLFLANLGVPQSAVAWLSLPCALIAEGLVP